MKKTLLSFILILSCLLSIAQAPDPIVDAIVKEGTENSQLEKLAHALLDGIGPRLVGTPQMQQAHDWALGTYSGWGITARNEKWGEWRGWERGISHIDLVHPRVKSLEGMQLVPMKVDGAAPVEAAGDPPCPACGTAAPLVEGACSDCGLQLDT